MLGQDSRSGYFSQCSKEQKREYFTEFQEVCSQCAVLRTLCTREIE
uniref:Uncharacterized protein n=1 Tax=Anguilla anguilla TaxID=7936 RepID=A0A0E9PY21_ANGAN